VNFMPINGGGMRNKVMVWFALITMCLAGWWIADQISAPAIEALNDSNVAPGNRPDTIDQWIEQKCDGEAACIMLWRKTLDRPDGLSNVDTLWCSAWKPVWSKQDCEEWFLVDSSRG
jgi:hypothetical protein